MPGTTWVWGNMDEQFRLQKYLSRAGVTSRRKAEELILAGRVKVNGTVVRELGTSVRPGRSKVEVDGKPVFWNPERVYLLLYKPTNYITSLSDPEDRPIVIDLLPKRLPRVVPVGRLDWDTEGLLLLTNDGDLAHRLTHPSTKIPRKYAVKVKGEVKEDGPILQSLKDGVQLDDGFVRPDRVAYVGYTGKHTWLEVELHSGANRVVRRMCEAVGHPVLKLRREAFGSLTLDGLREADYRDLSEEEVRALYAETGLDLRNVTIRSKKGVNRGMKSKRKPAGRSSGGRGGKPDSRGGKPESRGGKPDNRGGKPSGRGGKPDNRGGKPSGRGGKPDTRGGKPDSRGGKPDSRGGKPDSRGGKPSGRGGKPDGRGGKPGGRPGQGKKPGRRG